MGLCKPNRTKNFDSIFHYRHLINTSSQHMTTIQGSPQAAQGRQLGHFDRYQLIQEVLPLRDADNTVSQRGRNTARVRTIGLLVCEILYVCCRGLHNVHLSFRRLHRVMPRRTRLSKKALTHTHRHARKHKYTQGNTPSTAKTWCSAPNGSATTKCQSFPGSAPHHKAAEQAQSHWSRAGAEAPPPFPLPFSRGRERIASRVGSAQALWPVDVAA